MTSIVVLFNLKTDADVAKYERWAIDTDLPTAGGLASVELFEVLKTKGVLMSDDKPPYQYIEILKINDMEQFATDVASESMQQVAAQFQSFADNPLFILCEHI
ncbi:REDY-like protein HapK [Paraferrimonas sp. SM1919]|uniref:REDY-like protein HapK n=1 Tax=Paraferrimonas sp. SM1919 TaxID=2662263 RepID=UPI0013D0A223|nr:REDY-like protein HapK [Paraferrimonas sp. SM1919]